MSSSNMDMINLDSVDEWLENDLRQLGIILPPSAIEDKPPTLATPSIDTVSLTKTMINTPVQSIMASPPISECTPRMDPLLDLSTPNIKYEPLSPLETPKPDSQDLNKPQPQVDVQSFIKALTILGTMQQLQAQHQQQPQSQSQSQSQVQTPPSQIQTQTQQNINHTNNKVNHLKRDRNSNNNLTDEQKIQDLIALKRQRNTDAARRSRLRKAMKMESLEKRVMDLEAENERLKLRTAIAESERANIEAKEKSSRVRILELERQLADTHKALIRYSQKESTSMTV